MHVHSGSPFVMVIFGATGDLTGRKLMPALYSLFAKDILPERFLIVGVARRDMSDDVFRDMMRTAVEAHADEATFQPRIWRQFAETLHYQQGYFDDPAPYASLIDLLAGFDKDIGACITRFFYLATPPVNYNPILSHLASSKLSQGCGSPFAHATGDTQEGRKWTRILIEKPFGKDPQTAKSLEEQLDATFDERQIYRIDHYLAKETIQNILAFRFANGIFEPLWNSDHIDNVQISIAESAGIGTRGSFYEGVGALRDVAQNHLMAMLAYIAMDRPRSLTMDDIRKERVSVLQHIRTIPPADIVRGQYGPARIKDRRIAGYREEKSVSSDSLTETYVALKLHVDTARWKGVPFYLRTGKRLPVSAAQISIQFKQPAHMLFGDGVRPDVLTFRIQPREGISFHMMVKQPGLDFALQPVQMDFSYHSSFASKLTDSYERLLVDSMKGDQTLFATYEGFAATWELMQHIVEGWKTDTVVFPSYPAGTWGPKEADALILRDGRHWLMR